MFANSKQVLEYENNVQEFENIHEFQKCSHIHKNSWVQINEHGFKKCPQVEKCLQVKKILANMMDMNYNKLQVNDDHTTKIEQKWLLKDFVNALDFGEAMLNVLL